VTIWCRTILVQENLTRYRPLSRSSNTQRSRLDGLNMPKYPAMTQRLDLFGWARLAHPVGEPPHVVIQGGERLLGHHAPVVGGPTPDDRVEPGDHRLGVGPVQGL
jgi:hypothetical protein